MKKIICVALLAPVLSVSAGVSAQQGATSVQPIDRLRTAIERITKGVNATWGIYMKSVATNEELALDADRQMETMSTNQDSLDDRGAGASESRPVCPDGHVHACSG